MKKFLLFLAVFVSLAFWACSGEREVAGISTVETENAYLIQFVRGDSLPAANVVARCVLRNMSEASRGLMRVSRRKNLKKVPLRIPRASVFSANS